MHKAEREEMVFEIDGGEKRENEGEKERKGKIKRKRKKEKKIQ